MSGVRVGVDVGGTFTKAVALSTEPAGLRARAVVPTTHAGAAGVSEGVAEALRRLFAELGEDRRHVELVAFSTTQAMNALLEGDVVRVGVVGIGAAPDLRAARKRTRVPDIKLTSTRVLPTEHAFIDATSGLDRDAIDRALDQLESAGCTAVAVSGAFSVDAPEQERLVSERARERGLPTCAGHELSGTYGLEMRTVSAAINASILPVVDRTATIVERVLAETGIAVPLLVLRGDGGAMSLEAFRRSPSRTVGSGPAAGVAAALHQLALRDGIVLECGGTSSNVSVVKGGRTALRTLRVMGRPTAIRCVDSWVVGAAGGSMPRLGRRKVEETGPRSAHVAGLPYACYADPAALEGARLELVAPRPGDSAQCAILRAVDGRRFALTATCAAYALGVVEPVGDRPDGADAANGHCRSAAGPPEATDLVSEAARVGASPAGRSPGAGDRAREAARIAFAELGRRLGRSVDEAARQVLDRAVDKIARAAAEAARSHDFAPEVPIVALGGAGAALAPEVARRLGRPLLMPRHPEVLSSIGAALSLVRAEVERHHSDDPKAATELVREAERACVRAGAEPRTVQVETSFDARARLVRAIATGAVALESGAATRNPADEAAQRRAAASALGLVEDRLESIARNGFYRVFSENGSGGVAVVDGLGSVALAEQAKRIIAGEAGGLLEPLKEALEAEVVSLGIATLLPRVVLVCGPQLVDLSESRRPEDLLSAAAALLEGHDGPAVAVIWR
ncbi:MAG: hydantoinase/oxoprolinase family protein [Solirubrobacteraceae bacterium]